MSVPYIGFGNDTLAKQRPIKAGDVIECPECGGDHEILDGEPPGILQFYKCGASTYLAGVNGKSVIAVKPDCSGKVPL